MTHWSQAQKDDALTKLANGHTLTTVHHDLGPSISTLSRWARDAGIDVVQRRADKTREATAASLASREDRRAKLIAKLGQIADLASELEVAKLIDGEDLDLRDIVGARTRAIHDMELLAGRATSRTDTVTALDAEIAELTEALAGNDAELRPVDG